jgi:hypothetical protein
LRKLFLEKDKLYAVSGSRTPVLTLATLHSTTKLIPHRPGGLYHQFLQDRKIFKHYCKQGDMKNLARVVNTEQISISAAAVLYRNAYSETPQFMEAEKTTGILRRLLRLSDKYTAIPVDSLLDFQA